MAVAAYAAARRGGPASGCGPTRRGGRRPGYAGRRHLAWSEIERVRVDARNRLGAQHRLLEIDADPEIFLFSRYDLGMDPAEAAEALEAVREAISSR